MLFTTVPLTVALGRTRTNQRAASQTGRQPTISSPTPLPSRPHSRTPAYSSLLLDLFLPFSPALPHVLTSQYHGPTPPSWLGVVARISSVLHSTLPLSATRCIPASWMLDPALLSSPPGRILFTGAFSPFAQAHLSSLSSSPKDLSRSTFSGTLSTFTL